MDPTQPDKPPVRVLPLDDVRRTRGDAKIPVARSKLASTRAFRRIHADRLLGLLGVVFILFGTYLVFGWEKTVEPTPSFPVNWPEQDRQLPAQRVALTRDAPTYDHKFTVAEPNLTLLVVRLQWKDDVGDKPSEYDKLSFNLTGPAPAPLYAEIRGAQADANVGLNLTMQAAANEVPNLRQVPVRTLEEAVASVGDRTARNGTGEWTLRVTLDQVGDHFETEDARRLFGGTCPSADTPQLCTPDAGQEVEVSVEYRTYRVEFGAP